MFGEGVCVVGEEGLEQVERWGGLCESLGGKEQLLGRLLFWDSQAFLHCLGLLLWLLYFHFFSLLK